MTLPAIVLAAVVATATSVHFPVSTNDSAAQAAMDRGLFLYYAYDGEGAASSFEQAASRDPALAMAYWGVALANGPDLNTPPSEPKFDVAQRAIRRAALLDSVAPALERELIAIMARRYEGTFADWERNGAAYRQAMLALAQSSNDENVRLLTAEALLEHGGLLWKDGALVDDGSREALDIVTAVLRDDPLNPMANHLCIHLYDYAPDRRPALPCAQRLDAAEFPAQGEHLAHMPAHYWIETGNYAAAVASSDRAYALLSTLEETAGGAAHALQYRKHDVAVGYSAALMLGNYAVARLWAQRMQGAYDTSFAAFTALRFGRYADAYAASDAEFGNPGVRGLAALHLGRLSEARAIESQLLKQRVAQGYVPQLFLARMAEADGRLGDADRWIAQATNAQHAAFGAELIPLLPAEESLGFIKLRQAAYAGSIAAFTQALAAYPNDPRALYGLATALTANGQSAAAAQARRQFKTAWEGADTTLTGADLL